VAIFRELVQHERVLSASDQGTVTDPFAATRSSIRSRSTSQYLSDDRSSLSISSESADSFSSIVSGEVSERLLNFRGLRLNVNVRHLARLRFAAPINDSPSSPFLLMCSHHNAVAVVPKSFGISRSGSSGGPETSARDFAVDLGRR
jgi:hypothetical protein